MSRASALLLLVILACVPVTAQERPYFVTYDHHLEEPGNMEISSTSLFGVPKTSRTFLASSLEFGYGITGWWTSEFYLNGQSTRGDSTLFTGYRFENRFRLLLREHWINPVLYVEFSNGNGADKTLKEIVGFDSQAGLGAPNDVERREKEREIELKLILSSNVRGWNISENFITEKNLGGGLWEFAYAVGISRPLQLAARPERCVLCPENFVVGIESYGGLGEGRRVTPRNASHYLAPVMAWQLPNGTTMRISPGFGLGRQSSRLLLRWSVTYEVSGFGRRVRNLFR